MKRLIIVLCFVAFMGCATTPVKPVDPTKVTEEQKSDGSFNTFLDVLESTAQIILLWP